MILQAEWITLWILIRLLHHQKPADLDQHCFLKMIYLSSAGQGLIDIFSFPSFPEDRSVFLSTKWVYKRESWKRELVALLNLSWCLVMVERLFLAVPRGCLQFVIVVFPDHTHLLFYKTFFFIGNQ